MSASPLDALDASALRQLILRERDERRAVEEGVRRLQAGIARQNTRIAELEQVYRDLLRTQAARAEETDGLTEQNARLREQVARLHQELAQLRGSPLVPPVRKEPEPKPAAPVREKTVQKKRAGEHNHGRQRMERPNRWATHGVEHCPQCGTSLPDGWVVRRVQVIDLPLPAPLEITEHRVLRRQCPQCGKRVLPAPVGLEAGRIGQCRFGPRLLAALATMRSVERLPIALIRDRLLREYGLRLSMGGITGLLDRMAAVGTPAYDQIQTELRASGVVHADETGWRENGQHTTVWTVSTSHHIYVSHGRRTNDAIDGILGADYGGIIVCDCYGAYQHFTGPKQRCWAHLLRELQALIREHGAIPEPGEALIDGVRAPPDEDTETLAIQPGAAVAITTLAWAEGIIDLYRAAATTRPAEEAGWTHQAVRARAERARRYEAQVLLLCPERIDPALPYATLAKRLRQLVGELFTCVRELDVAATNNAAERSLRPLVIARKISGGTRSPSGSRTRMVLYTLAATARMQGKDPTAVFTALLLAPSGSPSPLIPDGPQS